MSAYGTTALCVLSAVLGAAAATALGLTRSHADTVQRVALLQHELTGNTERVEGLTREVSALRVVWNGTRAACPPATADGGATPALTPPAPPEHDVAAAPAPDDEPSAAQQELIAQAEQVIDRATRQRYWSERERDEWKRIAPQLRGPSAQELRMRVIRGLNTDFPPRMHGLPF